MQKNNGAVKHDPFTLRTFESLEYPGGDSVAQVEPRYKRRVPSKALPKVSSPLDATALLKAVWNRNRFDYCEQMYALFLNGAHHVHAWSLIAELVISAMCILKRYLPWH